MAIVTIVLRWFTHAVQVGVGVDTRRNAVKTRRHHEEDCSPEVCGGSLEHIKHDDIDNLTHPHRHGTHTEHDDDTPTLSAHTTSTASQASPWKQLIHLYMFQDIRGIL